MPPNYLSNSGRPNQPWAEAAARFYLQAIQGSDYEARVGSALHTLVGATQDLLDIGAGGGQPGAALLAPNASWTAVEPTAALARHLARRPERPRVMRCTWQALPGSVTTEVYDVALAANTPLPLGDPVGFLRSLQPLVRDAIAWVVPAQAGPRRHCLAGFLPTDIHGESNEPAVAGVLRKLETARLGPSAVQQVAWTFSARFSSLAAAQLHLERQFNPARCRRRRHRIRARLARLPRATDGSITVSVPKQSACLVWRH
ncbi:hypothetical protein J2T57_004017 [Natronocella acetinitrilica]|uniref:Uncharacterized protein n=1 Tax=Natronocella acetinitrilica TaxID=414046 RepID=A0AAE3G8A5_9GAMM|nr:hypothetical protein [Natronocella acetinitrilica]MCP1676844.1 hypothetical protein [Natronocella acetinitrilica]